MSKSIELSDEVFERIEAAASAAGITPAEWIAARLPECCPAANGAGAPQVATEAPAGAAESPKTLYERMVPHIGRVASGGIERLSQPSGNAFADYLVAKKREGRL